MGDIAASDPIPRRCGREEGRASGPGRGARGTARVALVAMLLSALGAAWLPSPTLPLSPPPLPPQETSATSLSTKDLANLARDLGSDDYRTREQATERLRGAGEAARSILEETRRSPDAEASSRAEMLLRELGPAPRNSLAPAGEHPTRLERFQEAIPGGSRPPPQVRGERAVVVGVRDELSVATIAQVRRAVKIARDQGIHILLVEINTPGGRIDYMQQIRETISGADGILTVAYVQHMAWSAGAMVCLACDRIYMTPQASIGSAKPIVAMPGVPGAVQLDEDTEEKNVSALRADFRGAAELKGRSGAIAEAMVDRHLEVLLVEAGGKQLIVKRSDLPRLEREHGRANVREVDVVSEADKLLNLTAREALELGFIDGIAEKRIDVLRDLGIGSATYVEAVPTWSEAFVRWIESWGWLLFVAGGVLLYAEFKVPGFGVPGILGIACLALFFFGKYLTGLAEMTELLLFLAGILLLGAEIFVIPGFGVTGILGILCLLAGALLSLQPFTIPDADWEWEVLTGNLNKMLLSLLGIVIAAPLITRVLPRLPGPRGLFRMPPTPAEGLHGGAAPVAEGRVAVEKLAGASGPAITDLRPAGKARLGDQVLDVVTEGEYIRAGARVRVLEIQGTRIVVRSVEGI